ncbi:MAG: hypothetical protein JWL98_1853 [Xanthomonadaceae bacterium]|nr:hypothetical protein [Xanthomonadaceae bacterium]
MTTHDAEFDPDDNFANGVPAPGMDADVDEDASIEAIVWQLLLMINPGDEDAALQQFAAYQEALATGDDDVEPVWRIRDVIDWKAGFHVDDDDPATCMDAIGELAARWNLRIDWGVEDASDDAFLAQAQVPALIAVAFDRLREYGYTLWTWDTGTDATAGWITLSRDDEGMRMVASALGIDVRTGAA